MANNKMHKYCSHCKRRKPVTDFNKNRCSKDGLQSYCRKCSNIKYKRIFRDKKYCPRCKQTKPKELFYKSKRARSGLSAYCKQCTHKYYKKFISKDGFIGHDIRKPSIDFPEHCPICGMGYNDSKEAYLCCDRAKTDPNRRVGTGKYDDKSKKDGGIAICRFVREG